MIFRLGADIGKGLHREPEKMKQTRNDLKRHEAQDLAATRGSGLTATQETRDLAATREALDLTAIRTPTLHRSIMPKVKPMLFLAARLSPSITMYRSPAIRQSLAKVPIPSSLCRRPASKNPRNQMSPRILICSNHWKFKKRRMPIRLSPRTNPFTAVT